MGGAARCGTDWLLLALLLPCSLACNFPVLVLYSFVPHLKLAVVQGITASTQRGWKHQWCFVSAYSSTCFLSVLCSLVVGVARCASFRGSTAQVAGVFPCLCGLKHRQPE